MNKAVEFVGSRYVPPTAAQIATCFNHCFATSHHTRLVGGASEPCYRPAPSNPQTATSVPSNNSGNWQGAELVYSHDYPASALHEIAHWSIAGAARRQLEDFGYPYQPPPRTQAEQRQFFRFEGRVQALEALFAQATGVGFVVSADNLAVAASELEAFSAEVWRIHAGLYDQWLGQRQESRRASNGPNQHRLPARALQFLHALQSRHLIQPNWPVASACSAPEPA